MVIRSWRHSETAIQGSFSVFFLLFTSLYIYTHKKLSMSTASWIQPPCRFLPDRYRGGGGFAKPSFSRARQFPGVVSYSSSCSCGHSEILTFDHFGNGFFPWCVVLIGGSSLILGIDLDQKMYRLVSNPSRSI